MTSNSVSDWSAAFLLGDRRDFFFTLQPLIFLPADVFGPGNFPTKAFCTYLALIQASLTDLQCITRHAYCKCKKKSRILQWTDKQEKYYLPN